MHRGTSDSNFAPSQVFYSFRINAKPEIMESYWCEKKNSIVNWINQRVDFDSTLTPCLKAERDMWRDGWCIHIRKAGKVNVNQLHKNKKGL